jgi:GDP-D-mannose 3', 5'-epimerase
MKTALVCGASGFIGRHLVRRLVAEGYWVRGVDIRYSDFGHFQGAEFHRMDLRHPDAARLALASHAKYEHFDEVYQLAADMGGMGWIAGDHDAEIMANNSLININILKAIVDKRITTKVFFSSSACVYPANVYQCAEHFAYPANPHSEYGWEKLYAERLYRTFARNHNLNVRIARFHNIFGPECTWRGGREKAPAAICRKVAGATDAVTIWGDGNQRRSFLYIDECIEGVRRLMASDYCEPLNIGSDVTVTIQQLVELVSVVAGKRRLKIVCKDGPVGVYARNSDNRLIHEMLGWMPSVELRPGLEKTYAWIAEQVAKAVDTLPEKV